MNIIDIERISKEFVVGVWRKKKKAVNDFSLAVQSGEILGIVGVNGAGKSSVLKMIMGYFRPDSGKILVAGISPSDPRSRNNLGYLPENPYFYDHLTAEELLIFSTQASGIGRYAAQKPIKEFLERVGLYNVRKQKLRSYSKGMTQRAGLCFALVHDPDVIILDEPMSGLDPLGRKMVNDIILDLKKKGKTVLFCSHILNDVERISDRIVIMDQGRLIRELTKEDIAKEENIVHIYTKNIKGALTTRLKTMNYALIKKGSQQMIQCEKESLDDILAICAREGVDIVSVDHSLNNMEKIFLREIGHN